jgi:ABC-type nickel/cobalt efflux system permease component RcnA
VVCVSLKQTIIESKPVFKIASVTLIGGIALLILFRFFDYRDKMFKQNAATKQRLEKENQQIKTQLDSLGHEKDSITLSLPLNEGTKTHLKKTIREIDSLKQRREQVLDSLMSNLKPVGNQAQMNKIFLARVKQKPPMSHRSVRPARAQIGRT